MIVKCVSSYSWFQEHWQFMNTNRGQTLFCFAHDNLCHQNIFRFRYLFHETPLLTCLLFHFDPSQSLIREKMENGYELNHVICSNSM